ncbi:xanthine dehydrogenase family protein molybdopterin-binding subunit [Kibdelosporangium aridum]|uniref:Xanthine dehydrogenase family protein molybdopterin-binding subunit n=1 Tax=Kibdelosporangium aridum TaxID=2030 RepID=A0A428ZE52_KIBAR|nr:molybdopterin cofactor-binding domain-containing protein [Kibdelosporangium aridum]RSM86315.1 xanthine dehydrogenase family protein molybdopterin-binding subunit [Kibdelosporangium aridum]
MREARQKTAADKFARRKALAFLAGVPTLTIVARFGLTSDAAPVGLAVPGLPDLTDYVDLGDLLTTLAMPTSGQLVLEVTAENRVVVQVPRAEVGQGITTAIAMIAADELDARLSDVDAVLSDARPELMFNQTTGGSNSIRSLYAPVRALAAQARARLITAAAEKWDIPANRLITKESKVFAPDGRNATFGSLSTAAAKIIAPAVAAKPKPESQQRIVGTPATRLDARDIVTGKAKFALDIRVPGAKPAVVKRPPSIGGTVQSVDDTAAKAMPGVLAVARIPSGVAVVAETFGQAIEATKALKVTWGKGTVDEMSDVDVKRRLRASVPPLNPLSSLTGHVDAEFDFAFVPHAPMETDSAVADVRSDRAEIWSSLKNPIITQKTIAKEVGLPQSKVTVHVTRGGGSFGRRLFFDGALEAAQISKATGRPIRLMWTRADDIRHGRMRGATHHKLRVGHLGGAIISYEHRVASVETDFRTGAGEALSAAFANLAPPLFPQAVFALTEKVPYNFGLITELLNEIPLKMHTASWRSVYSATVRTSEEILVDEVARKLGKDPVDFRRTMLKNDRARAVLDTVAKRGKWGRKMPSGQAQGIGFHEEYKSCVAYLVEIDAHDPRKPRVTKATIAADVGRPINPRGLESQLLGGLTDGISTILQAGVHLDKGLPLESSYENFRYAKQRHSPTAVDITIMPANGEPGGAGELGVPAAAAAVANAYARATGTSPRSFPINFAVDFEPLAR